MEKLPYTHTLTISTGSHQCELSSDGDAVYTDQKLIRQSVPIESVPGEYRKIRVLFYSTPLTALFNSFPELYFKRLNP